MKKIFLILPMILSVSTYAKQSDSKPDSIQYNQNKVWKLATGTHSHYDESFAIMVKNRESFNKIMGQAWYTERFLMDIILQEDAPNVPTIFVRDYDNWNGMKLFLTRNYDSTLVAMAMPLTKMRYYFIRDDWAKFIPIYNDFSKTYPGYFSTVDINNVSFYFFKRTAIKGYLQQAISWMEPLINNKPDWGTIDTYANLLYKVGKVKEAINWEEKAYNMSHDKDALTVLTKMKKGQKTWE